MMFSNLKVQGEGTDRMARFVNLSGKDTVLRIRPDAAVKEVYRSNVIEEEGSAVSAAADGWYEIPVGRYEIVTLGMK